MGKEVSMEMGQGGKEVEEGDEYIGDDGGRRMRRKVGKQRRKARGAQKERREGGRWEMREEETQG